MEQICSVNVTYKVLIWGTGRKYCQLINLLRFYELGGAFRVVGVTSKDSFYASIYGYPFIPKEKLKDIDFDYIIVACNDYCDVVSEAETLCGSQVREKMIAGRVLQHPHFNFEQYIRIKKYTPSIISPNCFGGLLYHHLGLPYLSPTINMEWTEEDYYELLNNLKEYMEAPLVFKKMRWNENLKIEYPLCSLGDIYVHMTHYKTYEEAKEKWEQRIKRINYDNLFIVSRATDKYWAKMYCRLPYKNHICFTNFEMKGCINVANIYNFYSNTDQPLGIGKIMNASTWGRYNLYNPFQILDTGDKEKVMEPKRDGKGMEGTA